MDQQQELDYWKLQWKLARLEKRTTELGDDIDKALKENFKTLDELEGSK